MYCPNCGNQSSEGQKFCRTCGTNLAIISKAVSLSEAIGRSDRGVLSKIKVSLGNVKLDQVSTDIAQGLEQLTDEVQCYFPTTPPHRRQRSRSPEQRREKYLVEGFKSLLGGLGLMIVLYVVGGVLVLRIPPEKAARIPFELEPVIRMAWLLGLIPALSGLGQIIASLFIRTSRVTGHESVSSPAAAMSQPSRRTSPAASVTEHTTQLLESSSSGDQRPRIAQLTK